MFVCLYICLSVRYIKLMFIMTIIYCVSAVVCEGSSGYVFSEIKEYQKIFIYYFSFLLEHGYGFQIVLISDRCCPVVGLHLDKLCLPDGLLLCWMLRTRKQFTSICVNSSREDQKCCLSRSAMRRPEEIFQSFIHSLLHPSRY